MELYKSTLNKYNKKIIKGISDIKDMNEVIEIIGMTYKQSSPTIEIKYKINNSNKINSSEIKLYQINITTFLEYNNTIDAIVNAIFNEHKGFLNKSNISEVILVYNNKIIIDYKISKRNKRIKTTEGK